MVSKKQNTSLLIWPALFALLFALSPLADNARLWGINHLNFFPAAVILIFCAFAVLCFIPQISAAIHNKLNSFHRNYLELPFPQKVLHSAIILIGCFIIFYIFRKPTAFLGDGYMRGMEIMRGFGYLPLNTEPLTALIHSAFHNSIGLALGLDGHGSIRLFSAIAGSAFILAILNIIKPKQNAVFSPLLLILGLGGIQFYFGYVESYGLMFIGLTFSIWYSYRYLSEGRAAMKALVIYTFAFFAHFAAIYVLPAFILLLIYALKDKALPSWKKLSGAGLFLIMIAGMAYLSFIYTPSYGAEERELLISLSPGGYWLFSAEHILDVLNSLLLSGMPALMLLPLLIKKSAWSKLRNGEKQYSLLILIGAFGFLILFNPELGFARDWDLFASTGLAISLFALAFAYRNREWISSHKYYIRTAILVPVVFTASYIAVNQNKSLSIERIEYVLSLYDERRAHGYETLGSYFRGNPENRDDLTRSVKYYRLAFEAKQNPRYLLAVGQIYLNLMQSNTDPSIKSQLSASLENYSRAAIQLDSTSATAYTYLMHAYSARGDIERAMQLTDSVLKYIKPENEAAFWSMRANIFCRNNMLDSCESNYRHAIELEPDMNIIYNHLGRVYKEMGEKDKAIEYLREFIQREPDSELRPQIRVLLRELTR